MQERIQVMMVYLYEGDPDVILCMRVPLANISHDKITQFTTELNSSRATANHNTVQEALPLFFQYACAKVLD